MILYKFAAVGLGSGRGGRGLEYTATQGELPMN